MSAELILVHGFLGLPVDWTLPGRKIDLYADFRDEDFDVWAERFCGQLSGKPVLVGYSMGARLAMHALARKPGRFSGAILISGNPGLPLPEQRKIRVELDEGWARRFEVEPWEWLMRDWNAQAVFEGSALQGRQERDFDRKKLASSLRVWSLGRQRDLRSELESLGIPMLWIAGERDPKFAEIARETVAGISPGRAEAWIAPGAGHRVPWDRPREFAEKVQHWIFQQGLGK